MSLQLPIRLEPTTFRAAGRPWLRGLRAIARLSLLVSIGVAWMPQALAAQVDGTAPAPGAEQPPAPPPQALPPPPVEARRRAAHELRVQQLQASLETLAQLDALSSAVTAVGGVLAGGLMTTYGVSVAIHGDELGDTAGRAALTGVALSAGVGTLVGAVYGWLAPDRTDRDRLDRFRLQTGTSGGPDVETLARFEGELAAAAAIAQRQRILRGVGAFALAGAGGALLAFGASDALQGRAQDGAYVLGGSFLGLGLLQAAASFLVVSPHERVFSRYEGQRLAAASPLIRIAFAPTIAPGHAGLGIHGRF